MTTTAADLTDTPSRTPLLAALGLGASAVLTATGTFWDVTNNDKVDDNSFADYWPVLVIAAVAAAIVYGLVVRTAAAGHPGRRALVLSIVGFLSNAVFWAGLPMVIVSAAVACALADRDKLGSFGTASKVALTISALATAGAVSLAITG